MKKICYFLFASLLFTACNKDKWDGNDGTETGYFSIGAISLKGDFVSESTAEEVDVDAFRIDFINQSTNETFSKYYGEIKDDILELAVGTYLIKVGTDADDNQVGYNLPIYRGQYENLVIKNSVLSSTDDIVCTLSNMKVSLTFSDTFKQEVEDYTVIVTADNLVNTEYTSFLIFDDEHTEGYFPVSDLTVHVRGVKAGTNGEVLINHVVNITGCEAQDLHLIDITAQPTGYGGFSVAVDYTLNGKEIGILIPGEDEDDLGPVDPVDPGPEPEDPITITAPGINSPLEISTANAGSTEVNIEITAENGIDQLWVEIESEFLTEAELASIGIPVKFDLANLNDQTLEYVFAQLQIIQHGQDIKGETKFTVNISAFMSLLVGNGAMDHKFHVTVIDGNGNEKKVTVVIRALE